MVTIPRSTRIPPILSSDGRYEDAEARRPGGGAVVPACASFDGGGVAGLSSEGCTAGSVGFASGTAAVAARDSGAGDEVGTGTAAAEGTASPVAAAPACKRFSFSN